MEAVQGGEAHSAGQTRSYNTIIQTYTGHLLLKGIEQVVLIQLLVVQELQKELELQVGLKQEMEVAMKLLEKDIHEKHDTLAALRQQLDQVKSLNLQMFNKAQVCVLGLHPKTQSQVVWGLKKSTEHVSKYAKVKIYIFLLITLKCNYYAI